MAQLLYQTSLDQLLQIIVKGSGAQFVLPVRLPLDFLHDPVAVQFLARQRQQNVKGSRRQGQERIGIFPHTRIPLYRIPSYMSRLSAWPVTVRRLRTSKAVFRSTPECPDGASSRRSADRNGWNRTRGSGCR